MEKGKLDGIDRRTTRLEVESEHTAKAIKSMSDALVDTNKMVTNMNNQFITLDHQLDSFMEDASDIEKSILEVVNELKNKQTLVDCDTKFEMYKDVSKRVEDNDENIKVLYEENKQIKKTIRFLELAFEHPTLATFLIFSQLVIVFYAMSHEWVGQILVNLMK